MTAPLRRFVLALAFGLVLVASGCLSLCGQRITLHYDPDRDELALLLQYDGVHHRPMKSGAVIGFGDLGDTKADVRRFLREDDVALLDWFGHVRGARIAAAAQDDEVPPALRALAAFWTDHVQVDWLGHYRDPDGRIGVAQLVVVPRASTFVELVNAALNARILDEVQARQERAAQIDEPPSNPRSWSLWAAAAERGHEWVRLDGHAVVVRAPIHEPEWKAAKVEVLGDVLRTLGAGSPTAQSFTRDALARFVAAAPLSIDQRIDFVTLRLGMIAQPSTLRIAVRDGGRERNLDDVVVAETRDLDAAIAGQLLMDAPKDPALQRLIAWGPPEESVRSALRVARDDPTMRPRARVWLRDFATAWDEEGRVPAAPPSLPGQPVDVPAWEQWYRDVSGTAVPRADAGR